MGILEDKGAARTFYRYLSVVYDRVNPFIWNEEMRDAAIAKLSIEPDETVLDVGCGTGFATAGLIRHSDEVHGIDQSIHQLEHAFEKFGRLGEVRFYRGDAERLPFADDHFDIVWSSGSIEYWPDPPAALREFHRVTRPGGQVLVVGPDAPRNAVLRRVADAIMLFYDREEAQAMFETAGFEQIDHMIQQAGPGTPRAITTTARVPSS
ncbi:MAG: methyltransferase domain-containing protein [Haloferacaceae archaeon]|jgi:demethylmenaquinone methyltransferase/2-methoxy-6-polyprenyl-1,4-benzoquinol methylase|nr:methyltransferase domain-containing protein [Haloferacaceae archaeon]